MARKRFNSEQIVAILREAEHVAKRPALFRKHGICEQTFYRWKRMIDGLRVIAGNVQKFIEISRNPVSPKPTKSSEEHKTFALTITLNHP